MAKTQDVAAALPGDVIQITASGALFRALMIVDECRRTFTRARAPNLTANGVEWLEHRVPAGAYAVVGCAALVEGETGRARETMKATLAEARK